ncbi:hypothetical protein MKW94_025702 [Papaver nudicaule]|uniref:Glycolipid transfer protein domain-containing protein n=1 Tax=Papaver nudicaule TaxID=74823 RepID=A0AA41VJY2_PAPNU|nr:hypothetical protein [Papaver nudicaule]
MPTLMGKMSLAFKDLAASTVNGEDMELKPFAQACSLIASLVQHLGPLFGFGVKDLTKKVANINAASKSFRTLISMLEADIERNSVRTVGSHSRNLLRFKRAIEMLKILFEQIVAANFDDEGDNSLVAQLLETYSEVFDQHHGRAIKASVSKYVSLIVPTKAQFLVKLEEDEASIVAKMKIIVEAATLVIQYIDNLFVSRGLGLDW